MQSITQEFLFWFAKFLAIAVGSLLVGHWLSSRSERTNNRQARQRLVTAPDNAWTKGASSRIMRDVCLLGTPCGVLAWSAINGRSSENQLIAALLLLLSLGAGGILWLRAKRLSQGSLVQDATLLEGLDLAGLFMQGGMSLQSAMAEVAKLLEDVAPAVAALFQEQPIADSGGESRLCQSVGQFSGMHARRMSSILNRGSDGSALATLSAELRRICEQRTVERSRELRQWVRYPVVACLIPAVYVLLLGPMASEFVEHFRPHRTVVTEPAADQTAPASSPGCSTCGRQTPAVTLGTSD